MPYLSKPALRAARISASGRGRALELGDLAGQLVDAPGHLGVAAEHLGLDLVDVVADAGDDGVVAVDHPVEDGVEDRLGPAAQQVGLALQAAPHGGEVGGLAVADGDHEVGTDEHVDLAELDLLGLVEVARRAQHDEQRVAVALQLGPLVGDDGVLDGELVELELGGQRGDLVLFRPVQPDPRHPVGLSVQGGVRLRQRRRRGDAVAVDDTPRCRRSATPWRRSTTAWRAAESSRRGAGGRRLRISERIADRRRSGIRTSSSAPTTASTKGIARRVPASGVQACARTRRDDECRRQSQDSTRHRHCAVWTPCRSESPRWLPNRAQSVTSSDPRR